VSGLRRAFASVTLPYRRAELERVLAAALQGRAVEPPRSRLTPDPATFAERPAKVLLVEDNLTNQLVALGLLRRMGLTVDCAASGTMALDALTEEAYDLVLMDVQMPDLDGLETTRYLRARPVGAPNREVPVIAMTAHALTGDRERCLAAGMDDYLPKPIDALLLAATLRQWLGTEGPRATTPTQASSRREQGEAAGSGSALRVFDRDGLMDRLLNDDTLARAVVDGFIADVPQQLAALHAACMATDRDEAGRLAHALKGAAANVGGERLRQASAEAEAAAVRGDLTRVAATVDTLSREFEALADAMRNRGLTGTVGGL